MRHRIWSTLGLLVALGACIDVTATAHSDATATSGNGSGTNPGTGNACAAAGVVPTILVTPTTITNVPGFVQHVTATFNCGGNIVWKSNNPVVATVNLLGDVTLVSPGTTQVCATGTYQSKDYEACVNVTTTGPTGPTLTGVTLSPATFSLVLSGANCTSTSQTQQITPTFLSSNGTAVPQSMQGLTWTTSDASVATVSTTGLVTAKAVGTATITSTSTSDATKSATSKVTVTVCTPNGPTITGVTLSPTQLNLLLGGANCSGSQPQQIGVTFVPANLPQNMQGLTWTTSNAAVATVSNTGMVSAVGVGTAVITATSTSDSNVKGTTPVIVTACTPNTSPAVISVTVTPATFSLILGGQGVVLTANVVAVGGAPTTVTWSVDKTCVSLAPNGNSVTVTPVGNVACPNVTAKATSTFDTSKSGAATGSVGSGTISCTFSSSLGQQADGVTIKLPTVGQQAVLTGYCTNQNGVPFIPFWYTDKPTIINVIGATTAVVINNQTYFAGPQATIKGIANGQAQVTMQAAVTDQTKLFSQNVLVGTAASSSSNITPSALRVLEKMDGVDTRKGIEFKFINP